MVAADKLYLTVIGGSKIDCICFGEIVIMSETQPINGLHLLKKKEFLNVEWSNETFETARIDQFLLVFSNRITIFIKFLNFTNHQ